MGLSSVLNLLLLIATFSHNIYVNGANERAARVQSVEANLVKYLLSRGYDVSTRPVPLESETTYLNISANSFALYQVDQAKEVVEFSAEFLLTWTDPFMAWNRSEFNVTWVKMKEMYVWKPDVIISSSISTEFLLDPDERYVDIRYDGFVRQSYYGVFFNTCKMKLNEVYSDHGAAIIGVENENFKGNSEWEFIQMEPETNFESDSDVNFNYTTVVWMTMLKRKPQFYFWVLLVPSFIITTVSLFGIFIPTNQLGDREEKVSLGLTTLLSTAVILEIVASTMPKASSLPMLGNFILAEIFVTAIGVLCSVGVLILHHRSVTRKWIPPHWIVRVSRWPFTRSAPHYTPQSPKSSKGGYPDEKKSALVSELETMLIRVEEWLEDEDREQARILTWACIFDKVDFVFVVFFQIANVVITMVIT